MENEVQNNVIETPGAQNSTPAPEEKKGLSIASMILGIVAIVAYCINGYLVLICAILAIVFGVIGKKKGGKGMARAGFILGIIALSIYVLIILLGATVFTAALAAFM